MLEIIDDNFLRNQSTARAVLFRTFPPTKSARLNCQKKNYPFFVLHQSIFTFLSDTKKNENKKEGR